MSDPILEKIVRALQRRAILRHDDIDAIRALPCSLRTLPPSTYIVREGDTPRPSCSFVISGFAYRQKLTIEGARQIVSMQMTGDFLDLEHLFLNVADHNVQALTRLQVADIPREALQALTLDRPAVGRAMWVDGLIDASISREWILNVGRRSARARIAHILCEFAVRMQDAEIAADRSYELPMTQEQLGDAVGLTSVHVNRTLKQLVADGLVSFDRRRLTILDWEHIQEIGEFSPRYLHMDQVPPADAQAGLPQFKAAASA